MDEKWKEFEKDCFKYLSEKYTGDFSLEPHGESDSTKADVEIVFADDSNFFIEIKESSSQCCQFVLFPNKELKNFEVSTDVKSPNTHNRQAIVEHMNGNYKKYSKVGRNGIPIDVEKDILYGWVADFYTAKKVKFFMTKGDEYIIFPIGKFAHYFDICAFYRKKPSGSGEPSKKNNLTEIDEGIKEYSLSGMIEFVSIEGKTRCFFHTDSNIHKKRIVCANHTYQFKSNKHSKKVPLKKEHVYEVRRLSNTANPNVICQLSLKNSSQISDDLLAFEEALKNRE